MLSILPWFLILPLSLLLFTLNLTLCGMLVTLCGLLKLLQINALNPVISKVAHWGYRQWLLRNRQLINLFNKVEWEVIGDSRELSRERWYLLIANHKSWLDIPVLEIRGISNMVGPRDRESWNIPLALKACRSALERLVAEV